MKNSILTSVVIVLLLFPAFAHSKRIVYKTVTSSAKQQLSCYGYTNQEKESELGGKATLLNYRARMYDCKLRKFLSPDKAKQQYGAYTYVANNPLNFVDKDGRIIEIPSEDPSILATLALIRLHAPEVYNSINDPGYAVTINRYDYNSISSVGPEGAVINFNPQLIVGDIKRVMHAKKTSLQVLYTDANSPAEELFRLFVEVDFIKRNGQARVKGWENRLHGQLTSFSRGLYPPADVNAPLNKIPGGAKFLLNSNRPVVAFFAKATLPPANKDLQQGEFLVTHTHAWTNAIVEQLDPKGYKISIANKYQKITIMRNKIAISAQEVSVINRQIAPINQQQLIVQQIGPELLQKREPNKPIDLANYQSLKKIHLNEADVQLRERVEREQRGLSPKPQMVEQLEEWEHLSNFSNFDLGGGQQQQDFGLLQNFNFEQQSPLFRSGGASPQQVLNFDLLPPTRQQTNFNFEGDNSNNIFNFGNEKDCE